MRWLFTLAVLLGACRTKPEEPPAPPHVERTGDLVIYASGASRRGGGQLPGVALGNERGPDFTLLSGRFAPLLIPDQSDRTYGVKTGTAGATVTVSLAGAFSAKITERRIVLHGNANLVLPASRTTVRGSDEGRPVFREQISAGGEPSVTSKAVDRLEIASEKMNAHLIVETDCPPRIIRPLPRGSTSAFLIRLGPGRGALDPLYAPEDARDEAPPCAKTATITRVLASTEADG